MFQTKKPGFTKLSNVKDLSGNVNVNLKIITKVSQLTVIVSCLLFSLT